MSIEDLRRFSAGSRNDDSNKHLWLIGAGQFVDKINLFLKHNRYCCDIIDISVFNNDKSTELGNILSKNRSDKSTNHNYNILYSYIFNKLGCENPIKILEVGMGTNNPSLVSHMCADGRPGASLYSWEEYLPRAEIYGADIDKDILFNAGRIKTHYVDQLNMETFNEMQKSFNVKYDLIIDDGLHSIGANLNTLLFALENVNVDGWIVIEDIDTMYYDNWFVLDYILKSNKDYECFFIKARSAYVYVIHKLR